MRRHSCNRAIDPPRGPTRPTRPGAPETRPGGPPGAPGPDPPDPPRGPTRLTRGAPEVSLPEASEFQVRAGAVPGGDDDRRRPAGPDTQKIQI